MTRLFRDSQATDTGGPTDPIPQEVRDKIEEIKKMRNKLPDNWKWSKCYELGYISARTGREFTKKHWALTARDGKGPVFSLGLISHDSTSNREDFMRDVPVQFVEQSLSIIDTLLPKIQCLQDRVRELEQALDACLVALKKCYDVTEYPANGKSIQDIAIKYGTKALAGKKEGEV